MSNDPGVLFLFCFPFSIFFFLNLSPSSRLERLLRKLNRSKGNRMFHSMNISCLFAMTGTIAEVFLSFFLCELMGCRMKLPLRGIEKHGCIFLCVYCLRRFI